MLFFDPRLCCMSIAKEILFRRLLSVPKGCTLIQSVLAEGTGKMVRIEFERTGGGEGKT